MKYLSLFSNRCISMSLLISSFSVGLYADNLPKANVNLTFVNNLNPAFVQSSSSDTSTEKQTLPANMLPTSSSILQLDYYDSNYSIDVGKSITEPLKKVDGELDTNDPNFYAMMIQLPILMVEYKHIPAESGDYYANQQCVYSPRIMNIISFTQSDETWQPSASVNQTQKSMDIQSNNSPEQSCSNFDFQYSMSVSPVASSQNLFNVDITFYIALNKNGVNALSETNNKINQANHPNNPVW